MIAGPNEFVVIPFEGSGYFRYWPSYVLSFGKAGHDQICTDSMHVSFTMRVCIDTDVGETNGTNPVIGLRCRKMTESLNQTKLIVQASRLTISILKVM